MRTNIKEADEILDMYFPVLDNGYISLKDYMGGDESIEQAARVSYGKGTRSTSDTRSLIRYLQRHSHSTPKEMTELTFHISMPIFVARQFLRHRTFNVNEYSGRYSEMPDVFYTPSSERITKQSKDNKQGSSDETIYNDEEYKVWLNERLVEENFLVYNKRLKEGWSKELARIDLPLSTYTYFYAKCDLHNLLHFLKLRLDEHAQFEVREYAKLMAGMVKRVCPIAFEAFIDYSYASKSFSRLDLEFLRWCQNNLSQTDIDYWAVDYMAICGTGIEKPHEKIGMGKRELNEFFEKIKGPQIPNFDLDISKAVEKK